MQETNLSQQEALKNKYPKIFEHAYPGVGNGWIQYLDVMCQHLEWQTKHNGHPQVVASQVKEKFGGLRFYTNGVDEYQRGVIGLMETLSNSICEECGSINNVIQTKGWIKTICRPCLTKHRFLSQLEDLKWIPNRVSNSFRKFVKNVVHNNKT